MKETQMLRNTGWGIAVGLVAVSLLTGVRVAQAGGCCGMAEHPDAASEHAEHSAASATTATALKEPLPSVMENYAKIEAALANDKLDRVPAAAQAIAKLVTGDDAKLLPGSVAKQADALTKATDLAVAREAFKSLSASLISYLDKAKVQTGRYYEVYCAMAKANWLQTDKAVKNPYYGQSMARCGEIKRTF